MTFLCATAIALAGCESHDSDYMPYALKGMNAYVYNEDDKEFFAGYTDGNYLDREQVLSGCQNNARAKAHELHLEDSNWGYVCCTVTAGSSCATKVK